MNIFNKTKGYVPPGAVYIGRPSKWGNPFSSKEGTLADHVVEDTQEALDSYYEYFKSSPELMKAAREELVGKDLLCWCKPKPCHGDVIKKILVEEGLEED